MGDYDVVIVGGGVAGLSLAKFLTEKGVPFLLIEEHTEFFKKPCGEGVISHTMGYDFQDLYGSKAGIEKEIWNTIIYTRYGKIDMEMPIIMMDKKKMEEELAKRATGGEIRMGEKVERIEGGVLQPQGIKPHLIIGADGALSKVREYAGLKKPILGIAAEGYAKDIEMDDEKCHIILDKDVVKYGYAWYFPKKNKWNIGVGSQKKKYFKEGFERFKKKNEDVKEWRGAFVPLDKPIRAYGKNALLIGDAASHVFSAIGAGITPSMIVSKIASDFIEKWAYGNFKNMDFHAFEKEWRRRIGKYLTYSYYTKSIFFSIVKSEYIRYKLLQKMCRSTTEYYRRVMKR